MKQLQNRGWALRRLARLSWIPVIVAGILVYQPGTLSSVGTVLWILAIVLQLVVVFAFIINGIRRRSARSR